MPPVVRGAARNVVGKRQNANVDIDVVPVDNMPPVVRGADRNVVGQRQNANVDIDRVAEMIHAAVATAQ